MTPEGWFSVALVFCRISGLLYGLPVFNTVGVPKHVSVIASLVLTILIAPTVPVVDDPLTLGVIVLGFGGELILGWVLALTVRTIFAVMAVAAEIVSRQTAMGMAMFMDPVQKIQQSPLGVLSSWMAGLAFLSMGLHLTFIEGIAYSFQWVPPGSTGLVGPTAPILLEACRVAILVGFQLSGPLLALVMLVNSFIGIMAKLAPKMNMFFSVGMTLNSVVGILVFGMALPWMLEIHSGHMVGSIDLFFQILQVMD